MDIAYKDGSTWRTMTNIYYKDGSTWRELSEVWYKDGSTWRQVFGSTPAAAINITNQTINSVGGSSAGYRLNTSGNAEQDPGAGSWSAISGEWLVSGAAADYECRFVETSGTVSTGSVGVWQALSSTRTWTVSASVGLEKTCVGTLSIRDVATSTVQDTAQITLYHDNR